MKTSQLLIILCVCFSAVAHNAALGSGNKGAKVRKNAMSPEERQYLLKHFDANGDGMLSASEKGAAKAHRSAKLAEEREELYKQYDSNKDGEIDAKEKHKAVIEKKKMKITRESVLKKYDKDGDGMLSFEERATFRDDQIAPSGRTKRGRQRQNVPTVNSQ